jgi:hypothetical protein
MRSPSSCTKSVFACEVRRPRRAGRALADDAPSHIAFRFPQSVGTQDETNFAAQCPAYDLPCRRFAGALARSHGRLGADVVCYSFIAVDLHHLLLASLLALAGPRPATGMDYLRLARKFECSPVGSKTQGRARRDGPIKPTRDVGCLNTVSNACGRCINLVHRHLPRLCRSWSEPRRDFA